MFDRLSEDQRQVLNIVREGHNIFITGQGGTARKNNCLLSSIFSAGEGGFGQMMYRSPEGHLRTPGMEFFCTVPRPHFLSRALIWPGCFGAVKKLTVTTNNGIQAGRFNSARRKKAKHWTQNQFKHRMLNYRKIQTSFEMFKSVLIPGCFGAIIRVLIYDGRMEKPVSGIRNRSRKRNRNRNRNRNPNLRNKTWRRFCLNGQMNQKNEIFSFVALPSPNTKKNHPKWDLGKDFSSQAFIER